MRKFLLKAALYGTLILAGYEALYQAGFLPIVTDSTLFDRKMAWLQQHPKVQPKLIVVGSSTALYGIRSPQMVEGTPMDYYNISSPLLNIASTWMIIRPIVRDFHPTYIVVASNVGDFCRKADSTYYNYEVAGDFVKWRVPELFYFLDFHSIHQIAYRKLEVTWLHFDQWGGGIKNYDMVMMRNRLKDNPDAFLGLVSFDTQFQNIHYQALDSMARWLHGQNVQLIFVQCPIRARDLAEPGTLAKVRQHFKTVDSIVGMNGGIFINDYKMVRDNDTLFFDAVHLWPPGGDIFTDSVVSDLKKIVEKNGK